MAQAPSSKETHSDWQSILQQGDRETFQRLVQPVVQTLVRAARHDLAYYRAQGLLQATDLSPEEVVGETLLHAWNQREKRPGPMSLRGWLLGTQHRVLRTLVRRQHAYLNRKTLSLDEALPDDPADAGVQEEFWEWYQPDADVLWEDIIPVQQPVDLEVPLSDAREVLQLDAPQQHVLMMHDEFEMTLPEVAYTMDLSIEEAARLLEEARGRLRASGPST